MQRSRDEIHDNEMMEDASDAKKCKVLLTSTEGGCEGEGGGDGGCATPNNVPCSTPLKSRTTYKKDAYFHHITPGVYTPPDSMYSHVAIPESCQHLVHMIMGKKGYHFKNITSISSAKYIWFNKEKNVIEIWGPMRCHERASKLLYGHMNACFERAMARDAKKQQTSPPSNDEAQDQAQVEVQADSGANDWNIRLLPSPEDMDMETTVAETTQ
jgi:hypothetical protein